MRAWPALFFAPRPGSDATTSSRAIHRFGAAALRSKPLHLAAVRLLRLGGGQVAQHAKAIA